MQVSPLGERIVRSVLFRSLSRMHPMTVQWITRACDYLIFRIASNADVLLKYNKRPEIGIKDIEVAIDLTVPYALKSPPMPWFPVTGLSSPPMANLQRDPAFAFDALYTPPIKAELRKYFSNRRASEEAMKSLFMNVATLLLAVEQALLSRVPPNGSISIAALDRVLYETPFNLIFYPIGIAPVTPKKPDEIRRMNLMMGFPPGAESNDDYDDRF